MTAKIEAESTATRKILLDNLPALRERLAEQEIRIEKFEVDVRDQGRGGQSPGWEQSEREAREGRHRPDRVGTGKGILGPMEDHQAGDGSTVRLSSTGINVVA